MPVISSNISTIANYNTIQYNKEVKCYKEQGNLDDVICVCVLQCIVCVCA